MNKQKIKILSTGMILILITVGLSGCIDDPGDGKPTYDEVKSALDLRSPTYDEMVEFVKKDRTNQREYIDNDDHQETFTCGDFSDLLIKNARKNVFDVGYVIIYQTEDEYFDLGSLNLPPHAIVCFNTIEGTYFVEPQNDKIMSRRTFRQYQRDDCYPYANGFIVGLSYNMDFHHYKIDWFHDIIYSWDYDSNKWLIDC